MSLLASPRRGYALLGWRPMLLVSLGLGLFPALLGGVILLLVPLFGQLLSPFAREVWASFGMLGLISPLLTLPLLLAIGICAALALQAGQYGAIQTILIALLIGLIAELQTGIRILPFYAVMIACVQRLILALIRPFAF